MGFAGNEVEELQRRLGVAMEKADEVVGIIANAVGDPPRTEAGSNALGWTAHIREELEIFIGLCESIKSELNRYDGGF